MARRPPSTAARPRWGWIRPARTLRRVVLPAPFGPNTASVWPGWTVNDTSSSALIPPKRCRRPSASSIDRGGELAQFVRFDEVAAVAQVEHVHQRLHAHVRRRDDDRERGPRLPDALQQRDPVGVRQAHIQHQDVRLEMVELTHGLRAVWRVGHGVSSFKVPLVGVLQRGFVFDEQNLTWRHRANLSQETPVSNSKRSSNLVRTRRKRSSSLAPRRHTVWRRSAALRWISIKAPRPALSTERVPDRSITRRPAPSASRSSTSPAARRNAVRDSRSSRSGAPSVFSIGRVDISVFSTGIGDIIPPPPPYATPMPCSLRRAASTVWHKLVSLLTLAGCRIASGAVQLARVTLFLNIPNHGD